LGDLTGPNPTDREPRTGRNAPFWSRPTEARFLGGRGWGENVREDKLLGATLDAAVVLERPEPTEEAPHSTCAWTRATTTGRHQGALVEGRSYVPHIRGIGEEKLEEAGEKRYPARRWVVERTLGWLSKCRAILVRYEKKAANYLGLIKMACILLWYRRQHRLSLLR
jgi:putative transposase